MLKVVGSSVKQFGNCTAIVSSKHTRIYFILGPNWPLTSVTFTLIFIGTILAFKSASSVSKEFQSVVLILSLLTTFLLTCLIILDPGILLKPCEDESFLATQNRVCVVCENVQPPLSHHCEVCNCCITQYHHHCPWLGKCIGEKNLALYRWFTFTWISFLSVVITSLCFQLAKQSP